MIACFYLPEIGIACERARVPHLADEALALGSGEATIVAVSEKAASAGVTNGMSLTAARSLCQSLIILPYNRAIYADAAEAVWDVLASESDLVEPASPEIVFVEFPNREALNQAQRLARILADRMQIRIFIGVGTSKLVARQAAQRPSGKDRPLLSVIPGTEAAFLASVPISVLDNIAQPTRKSWIASGSRTLEMSYDCPTALRYQFKEISELLKRLALGDDNDRVRACWPPPSEESHIRFEEEVEGVEALRHSLGMAGSSIAQNLQEERTYCRTLTLTVTLADRSILIERGELKSATNGARELTAAAKRLLERLIIDQPVIGIKLKATGLGTGSATQLTLLEADTKQEALAARTQRLESALNFVKAKFGISAVILASLLYQARRIDLWVSPLAHRRKESVQVATSDTGTPVRMYRSSRQTQLSESYDVVDICDQWRESSWAWDNILETSCWRVVTDPFGLHQLEEIGLQWTLTASAD